MIDSNTVKGLEIYFPVISTRKKARNKGAEMSINGRKWLLLNLENTANAQSHKGLRSLWGKTCRSSSLLSGTKAEAPDKKGFQPLFF